MAGQDLRKRIEPLEAQVARIQSELVTLGATKEKDWRRAVDKYLGDEGLLAVFAEGKKLRDAERAKVRQRRSRRSKS